MDKPPGKGQRDDPPETVVITDPIPGGATILGGGLGRDSQIATSGQKSPTGNAWPAFEERSFEAYRSYYEYVPKGVFKMEYTVRLNNVGEFSLPPRMVAPPGIGSVTTTQVMSAEALTSSATRHTSPRVCVPLTACSTGVMLFLIV